MDISREKVVTEIAIKCLDIIDFDEIQKKYNLTKEEMIQLKDDITWELSKRLDEKYGKPKSDTHCDHPTFPEERLLPEGIG